MLRFAYGVAMPVFIALSLLGAIARAAATPPPSVTIPALASPPSVAGAIDASWKDAARIELRYDWVYRRPAGEPTTVSIAQSRGALYIAYDVHQREPRTVEQTTNGAAVENDDHVALALYPQGSHGFMYIFRANPNGARDQSSSENSAYAPQWDAVGRKTPYGYVVTMRIPFDIMRSGGSKHWRAQFVRITAASGSRFIWAYDPSMAYDIDVNYIGTLDGIEVGKSGARPPARLQVYSLGEFASKSVGGSTSRVGADLSVPISPTASFVATIHPDYSNVEVDQQSISPQEFPRYYQEVRPFFTQIGSQFNGHFGCWNCPTTLYTPSIPAFSQGYAVEGTQGPTMFAAFDAIGPDRTDQAQSFGVFSTSQHHQAQLSLQRVSVDTPGVHDVTSTVATGYSFSRNHAFVFANAGMDRGTFVPDANQGGYQEYGAGLTDSTSNFILDYQRVGSQFAPVDGYVSHPGIAGLLTSAYKTINYSGSAYIQQVTGGASWDRYHDDGGRVNQADVYAYGSLRTRSLLGLSIGTGSSLLLVPDGELLPFNQDGVSLSYRAGTATASYLNYAHGRYYHGFLASWYRSTALRLAKPLILSLEADNTHYVPDAAYGPGTKWNEIGADQLLERATMDWQFSHKASLDFGVRRVSGIFAPTGFGYVPTVGTDALHATNLSAAFHFLALRNEFYVVYGDPNELSTSHALFLKWIRYIGAPKGT
ncbi:MAG TPA: hypothetical protein VJP76_08060 [Candidatus Tumulicola sp.]|nr:hypothetical protein [Candidatus Tumulicola sp.]